MHVGCSTNSPSFKEANYSKEDLELSSLLETERKRTNSGLSQSRKHSIGKQKKLRRKQRYSRKLWSEEEDEAISQLVEAYGTRRWTYIAKKLQESFHVFGRSGKQCRERHLYHNLSLDGITT